MTAKSWSMPTYGTWTFASQTSLRPCGVNSNIVDDVAAVPFGLVAERDHVARARIDLRMRRERSARQLAVERVGRRDRLERQQVQRRRRAVLFQREQVVAVIDDVRVGRAAAQAFDARVVHRRIAVHREQDAAGFFLCEVAVVAHEAAAVIHTAVLDAEHADVAFAVERNVAARHRILRVGTDAIEGAAQVGRYLARHFAVMNVCFEPIEPRLSLLKRRQRRIARPRRRPAARRPSCGRLRGGAPDGSQRGGAKRSGHQRAAIEFLGFVFHRLSPAMKARLRGRKHRRIIHSKAAATWAQAPAVTATTALARTPAPPFSCTSQSTLPSMGSLALKTVRRST